MQNPFEILSDRLIGDLRMRRSHSRHFLIRALNRRMLQDVDDFLPPSFEKWGEDKLQDRFIDRKSRLENALFKRKAGFNFGQNDPSSVPVDHFSNKSFPVEVSRSIPISTHHKPPPSFSCSRSNIRNFWTRLTPYSTSTSDQRYNDTDAGTLTSSAQLLRTDGDGSEAFQLKSHHPIPIQVSHVPLIDEPPDFVSPHLLLLRSEKNRRQMARVRVARDNKPVPVRTEVLEASYPTLVSEHPFDSSLSDADNGSVELHQQRPLSDPAARMSARVLKHIGNPPREILRSSRMRFGAIQHVAVGTSDVAGIQHAKVKGQETDNIETVKSEEFHSGKTTTLKDSDRTTQVGASSHALRDDASTQNDVKMFNAEVMHGERTEFSLELGPIEMDIECYPVCNDHPAGFGKPGFDISSRKPSYEISSPPNGTYSSFYRLSSCEDNLEDRITDFGNVNVDDDVSSTVDVISKRVDASDVIKPISKLVQPRIEPVSERFDGSRPTSKCTCDENNSELTSPPGIEPSTPVVSCKE